MTDFERGKLEKLVELLAEQRIILERIGRTTREVESVLRVRLNDDFSIKS